MQPRQEEMEAALENQGEAGQGSNRTEVKLHIIIYKCCVVGVLVGWLLSYSAWCMLHGAWCIRESLCVYKYI